jgi:hypothetical protein
MHSQEQVMEVDTVDILLAGQQAMELLVILKQQLEHTHTVV